MPGFAVITPDAVAAAESGSITLPGGYRVSFPGGSPGDRAFTRAIRAPGVAGVILFGSGASERDIASVAGAMLENPGAIAVGQRSGLKRSEVLTSRVFSLFSGVRLSDAVSGLIGVPGDKLRVFPEKPSKRFFLRTLLYVGPRDKIVAVPLDASGRDSTPVEAVADMLLILRQFVMMTAASLSSAGLDYLLYILLVAQTGFRAGLSYAAARVFSSLFNYALNSRVVFKSGGARPFARYYLLALCIMAAGALATHLFADILGFNSILCKLLVDLPLFLASYFFQKKLVFAG